MRYAAIALSILLATTVAAADDVSITIAVTFYECLAPKSDPTCVAFDEASKPKSCPSCKGWRKVTVDAAAAAKTESEYSKPNDFIDDVAKQIYGEGLPKNPDGQPISIGQFYENHDKYGWVEVPPGESREGALAVLPSTAGVVVDEKTGGDIEVIYSSTKRGGDVTRTDLDNLTKLGAEPVFVLPASFLEKVAEAAPPPNP